MKQKKITAKYNGKCCDCSRPIRAGWQVWWNGKAVTCTVCYGRKARVTAQNRFAINNPYGGMRT